MSSPVVHESSSKSEAANYKPPSRKIWITRVTGLLGGIIAAILIYFIMPDNAAEVAATGLSEQDIADKNFAAMPIVAGIAILMGLWWMTEAIPLAATALIPLFIFPALQVDSFKGTASSYAADTIFMFMGGFIIALAMQRWNLHRRIALNVVLLVGTKPRQLVLGFMVATGFISMWVSNTATAVMMLPIGLSVLQLVGSLSENTELGAATKHAPENVSKVAQDATRGGALGAMVQGGEDPIEEIVGVADRHHSNFAVALMLGIAYSASIGSLGTIIGTPPNTLLIAYLSDQGIHVGFGQWMVVGVPLAVTFLLIGWAVLVYLIYPPEMKELPGGRELIKEEVKKLGKIRGGEAWVLAMFLIAALSWVFVPVILKEFDITIKGIDAIISMGVSLLLFIIPADAKNGVRLMNWETAKDIPWDILLLFGGGLALSNQFSHAGLSNWIGQQVSGLKGLPTILLIIIVVVLVLAMTELTSNTATAAALLPIMGGVALGLGLDGHNIMLLTVPVALAATCAFSLPAATPPNAIAYGSGYVRITDMIKAGLWMNLTGVILITATLYTLFIPYFGLSF